MRVAAAVVLFVGASVFAHIRTGSTSLLTLVTAVVVSAAFAVVPALRWQPWLVPATAAAGVIVLMPGGAQESPARPALVLAMLVYSLRSELAAAVIAAAAVSGAVGLVGSVLSAMQERIQLESLAVVPYVLAAAATGQAVRANRAQRAMLEERAVRAEQGREDEARRRLQAERIRIARDLHDAVGHHVALISVQAGALTYLLDRDPARARESVEHIQNASGAALEELRLTVGLLREPGEEHEPVEPAGRLGRLDELIASFTAAGLRVTCEVSGPARPLPEAVDLTAFRLIQESLTNTAKHAAATSAAIRLTFRPGTLALAVDDDGPPPSDGEATPTGHGTIGTREQTTTLSSQGKTAGHGTIGTHEQTTTHSSQEKAARHGTIGTRKQTTTHSSQGKAAGHGIIGMRERAVALGGQLTAGPRPEGGFRVSAELPAPAGAP
ncbi:two-component sensor histidine kinase [Actinoplanes sp. ATCC 53533]|nr:two-component sensor histidine kinase [Actinoplanes sp. ATCC 53533]